MCNLLCLGIVDHMLGLMARCAGSKGNECESLHKLIHNNGKALPVTVGTVDTRVLVLTGKPRVETVGWPVLFLSAWAQQLFSTGGKVLLGGHTLDNPRRFRKMFTTFWDRFQHVRPDLDIYRRTDRDMGMCIPIALHGDEGRGKLRRPVMILSFQPIISHKGPHFINSSGHLNCSASYESCECATNPSKASPIGLNSRFPPRCPEAQLHHALAVHADPVPGVLQETHS